MKKLLFALAATVPAMCWAATPQEIEALVKSGNLPAAESALRQVIKEHPSSARAHYDLGQVLELENSWQAAYDELMTVSRLDRSIAFASDIGKYRSALRKAEINLGKTPAPEVSSTSHATQYLAAVLLLLGVAGTGGVIYARRRQRARDDAAAQQQLRVLVKLASAVDDAACEAQVNGNVIRDYVVKSQIDAAIRDIKNTRTPMSAHEFLQIQQAVDQLRGAATAKKSTTATANTTVMATAPHEHHVAPLYNPQPTAASSAGYAPVHAQHPTAPIVHVSAPVYHDNSSGMVEGMVVGAALASMTGRDHHESTTVINNYTSGSSKSSRDRDDDDDNSYRRSSSSYDSGSNDSSSYDSGSSDSSSYDSGSSSYDSGSSGSDW